MITAGSLLEVRDLAKSWSRAGRTVQALAGVSLDIRPGETLALVGASGSGKTTLARLVMGLMPADRGSIRFEGQELMGLAPSRFRRLRPRLQMVFQDPLSALNPRATIGRLLADPFRIHRLVPGRQRTDAVLALMQRLGLPALLAARYPHELSGGQRQRVLIGRALATAPALVLLDEPTSALDVSVRGQILNLLKDLQADSGPSYLLITHDLAVVRAVADRIAVLEEGRIVETGAVAAVLAAPAAEATRRLLAAVPRLPRLAGGG